MAKLATAHSHPPGATNSKGKGQSCCCERNWCPVCSLPTCRPHRDTQWADGTLKTTYDRDYDEKKGSRGVPGELASKDKLLINATGQFNPETTQKADYTQKHASRRSCKPGSSTISPRPFEGQSTYQSTYQGKTGLKPATSAPAASLPSAPFHGISSHQADYQNWGVKPQAQKAAAAHLLQVPFDGTTTYHDDFQKKRLPAKQQRAVQPLLPSMHCDNYTTYGTDYVQLPLHQASGHCCDNPHHPQHHVHVHSPKKDKAAVLGNTTGRLYRL